MAAHYTLITLPEIETLLVPQGFTRLDLGPAVQEVVLARAYRRAIMVGEEQVDSLLFSLRVYTSIHVISNRSRGVGEDAIRVCAFMQRGGKIYPVGHTRRVNRVENWRMNLQERIENWWDTLFPPNERCPQCDSPMRLVKPGVRDRWSEFHGCVRYPDCKATRR